MGDRYSLAADDCGKRCSSLSLQSLIALSVGPLVLGKFLQYRTRIIKHARQTRYSIGICGAPNAWDTAQLRTCIIKHARKIRSTVSSDAPMPGTLTDPVSSNIRGTFTGRG